MVSVTFPMLCVGYAIYGEAVQSPIYNTPALAASSLLRVMIALITVHLIGAYAIVLNPTERALEVALGVDERRAAWLWRMCLRTLFVLFTYGSLCCAGTASLLCWSWCPLLLQLPPCSFALAPSTSSSLRWRGGLSPDGCWLGTFSLCSCLWWVPSSEWSALSRRS